jgi:hypothetical protein
MRSRWCLLLLRAAISRSGPSSHQSHCRRSSSSKAGQHCGSGAARRERPAVVTFFAPTSCSSRSSPQPRRMAWTAGSSSSQHLLSRGGCQNRRQSLVNCDHGDSTTSRFDAPGQAQGAQPPTAGADGCARRCCHAMALRQIQRSQRAAAPPCCCVRWRVVSVSGGRSPPPPSAASRRGMRGGALCRGMPTHRRACCRILSRCACYYLGTATQYGPTHRRACCRRRCGRGRRSWSCRECAAAPPARCRRSRLPCAAPGSGAACPGVPIIINILNISV